MAICEDCQQEMIGADACDHPYLIIQDGQTLYVYERDTEYHDNNERCHDCGIVNGNVHHAGCDMERCPVCGGQFLGACECFSPKNYWFAKKGVKNGFSA